MASAKLRSAVTGNKRRQADRLLRTEFAERLLNVLELRGYSGYGRELFVCLATQYGVTPSATRKWLSGLGFPEVDTLVRVSNNLHVSLDHLLRGTGSILDECDPGNQSSDRLIALLQLSKSFSLVPVAEATKIERGARTGNIVAFTRDWLAKHFGAADGEIDAYEASGDAMAPEVNSGDFVVYRSGIKALRRNGLYVLRQGETTKLRRILLLPNGKIRMACTNRRYPSEIFSTRDLAFGQPRDANNIVVLGRCIGRIKSIR